MAIRVWGAVLSLVLAASASKACMRLQMDDRAVQWSTAIVEARLTSLDPPVKLEGLVKTYKPALGVMSTWYYYRVYHMEVTRSLDGTLKKGDSVPIVRLFWRAKQTRCQQNLTLDSVGKEFLVMLEPVSTFKSFVPEGVSEPKVKDGMFIVHLELKETLPPSAISELEHRIASVRATEQQIDPRQVERLIAQIKSAPTPERIGPPIRALERLGPKVVPQLEAAMKTTREDYKQAGLINLISHLSPPPTTQGLIWPEQDIEEKMAKK